MKYQRINAQILSKFLNETIENLDTYSLLLKKELEVTRIAPRHEKLTNSLVSSLAGEQSISYMDLVLFLLLLRNEYFCDLDAAIDKVKFILLKKQDPTEVEDVKMSSLMVEFITQIESSGLPPPPATPPSTSPSTSPERSRSQSLPLLSAFASVQTTPPLPSREAPPLPSRKAPPLPSRKAPPPPLPVRPPVLPRSPSIQKLLDSPFPPERSPVQTPDVLLPSPPPLRKTVDSAVPTFNDSLPPVNGDSKATLELSAKIFLFTGAYAALTYTFTNRESISKTLSNVVERIRDNMSATLKPTV